MRSQLGWWRCNYTSSRRYHLGSCLAVIAANELLGHRKTIAKWVIVWLVINGLFTSVLPRDLSSWSGQWIVPGAVGSLWQLALILGLVPYYCGRAVNLMTNLVAVISFAILQGHVYDRFARKIALLLPEETDTSAAQMPPWNRFRISTGVLCCRLSLRSLCRSGGSDSLGPWLDDVVEITAHRGGAGKSPENTMASILAGIEDKTDWIEIDVQESKDGIVIVAHDSDLKRVSGKGVKIWEATADELQAIDIGSYFAPQFRNERVPTLASVLEACKGKARVNIELKYYGHDQNLEQKVVDLVERHGMQEDVVIMSLEAATGIRKVKEIRHTWKVGLLSAVAVGDLTQAKADFLGRQHQDSSTRSVRIRVPPIERRESRACLDGQR